MVEASLASVGGDGVHVGVEACSGAAQGRRGALERRDADDPAPALLSLLARPTCTT